MIAALTFARTRAEAHERIAAAIVKARPANGWITSGWIASGWTAQPEYREVRS